MTTTRRMTAAILVVAASAVARAEEAPPAESAPAAPPPPPAVNPSPQRPQIYQHVQVIEQGQSWYGGGTFYTQPVFPWEECGSGIAAIDCLPPRTPVARTSALLVKLDDGLFDLGSGKLTVRARVLRGTPVELSVENYTKVGDDAIQPSARSWYRAGDVRSVLRGRAFLGAVDEAIGRTESHGAAAMVALYQARLAVDRLKTAVATNEDVARRQPLEREVARTVADALVAQRVLEADWDAVGKQFRERVLASDAFQAVVVDEKGTVDANGAPVEPGGRLRALVRQVEQRVGPADGGAADGGAATTGAFEQALVASATTHVDIVHTDCLVTPIGASCAPALSALSQAIDSSGRGQLDLLWHNASGTLPAELRSTLYEVLDAAAQRLADRTRAPLPPARVKLVAAPDLHHDDVIELLVELVPASLSIDGATFELPGTGLVSQTFSIQLRVVEVGLTPKIATEVVLVRRLSDRANVTETSVPSNWKPTAAAGLTFQTRCRERVCEWLVPSFGVAAVLPDFDPSRDWELGLALNLGWLNELVHFGIGYNLAAKERPGFMYLGLDFLRTAQGFGMLFDAGDAS